MRDSRKFVQGESEGYTCIVNFLIPGGGGQEPLPPLLDPCMKFMYSENLIENCL